MTLLRRRINYLFRIIGYTACGRGQSSMNRATCAFYHGGVFKLLARHCIKYTWDISYKKAPFLDVMAELNNGVVSTDMYSKPTDAHQYFNFKSCHPPHVRRETPFGQALRLKHICHSEEILEKRLIELKGLLANRGYDNDFVESQFDRVRLLDRSALFNKEPENCSREKEMDKSTFVIDSHLALLELYGIVRELQNIVGLSGIFLSIMPQQPMVCFPNSKSLQDRLVGAIAKLHKIERSVN